MSKISELSDGTPLVSSDYLIAVRAGGNVKVRLTSLDIDQVNLGDNEFIRLGNSQDLTMVHNATNSIINQAGIGDLLIQKAGSTKLTINASGIDVTGSVTTTGSVGIGSTAGLSGPSAATTLRIGNQINLYEYDDSSNPVQLNLNQNIDSNENYIATDQAARYQMRDGVHSWFSVASGTAGTLTNIGANEKMRIDGATGSVGIGTSSPSSYYADKLVVSAGYADGITIAASATTDINYLMFADTTTSIGQGWIGYYHNGDALTFGSNSVEAMRIDSSGRQLIGYTSSVGTTYQTNLQVKGSSASNYGGLGIVSSNNEMLGVVGTWSNGENSLMIAADPDNLRPSSSIVFTTDAVEAMRIDASGDIRLTGTAPNAEDAISAINFFNSSSGTNLASIIGKRTAGGTNYGSLIFNTTDVGTAAERMRIASNGSVGIGVVPSAWDAVFDSVEIGQAGNGVSGNSGTTQVSQGMYYNAGYKYGATGVAVARYEINLGEHRWTNAIAGTAGVALTSPTQVMTLDASGNLLLGKSVVNSQTIIGCEIQTDGEVYSTIATGFNSYHVYANGGYRFYVNANGGIHNYSANNVNLSDEREKKNIELLESQWDSLKQWSLKKFHYNADDDSDNKTLGVIAQEVEAHNPEVIDEFNVDDDTTRLAVKEQQMMWMAIKALQEAQTRIESLEARIAALES